MDDRTWNLGAVIGFAGGVGVCAVSVVAMFARANPDSSLGIIFSVPAGIALALISGVIGAALSGPATALGFRLSRPMDAAVFGALCLALPALVALVRLNVRGGPEAALSLGWSALCFGLIGGAAGVLTCALDARQRNRRAPMRLPNRTRRCVALGAAIGGSAAYGTLGVLLVASWLQVSDLVVPFMLGVTAIDALAGLPIGALLGIVVRVCGWELSGSRSAALFGVVCQAVFVASLGTAFAFRPGDETLLFHAVRLVFFGLSALLVLGLGGVIAGISVGALARWCGHTTALTPPSAPENSGDARNE